LEECPRESWNIDLRTAIVLGLPFLLVAGMIGTSYSLTNLQICIGTPHAVSFTLIMTNQGFNGSVTHTDTWPVLHVGRCDAVTVILTNQDMTAHGFAITHYLDSGVKVQPGESIDVRFNANKAGTFLVYCNILCPIHLSMQNGRLNVL
jgi:heme/copper-type cytochrome/quinol oxidase subunit 2